VFLMIVCRYAGEYSLYQCILPGSFRHTFADAAK